MIPDFSQVELGEPVTATAVNGARTTTPEGIDIAPYYPVEGAVEGRPGEPPYRRGPTRKR